PTRLGGSEPWTGRFVEGVRCFLARSTGSSVLLFFFQAEDGIRDFHVTGVQTCALPILGLSARRSPGKTRVAARVTSPSAVRVARSEERRVGKECRSGRSPHA